MKNYIQRGDTITHTTGGSETVASGDLVVLEDMVGVAITDIAASSAGELNAEGVHRLPKAAAAGEIVQGEQVYAAAGEITDVDTDTPAGKAWATAAEAATDILVKINA